MGDKPMDIDGKNDECDKDTGDYFNAISDFKYAHQNNFVFIHITVYSLRHIFANFLL